MQCEQVAAEPLRQTPPDWSAFAVETAILFLRPKPHVPEQLQADLQDAGRRLAAAAMAHADFPVQQGLLLPEPAAAVAAMKGDSPFRGLQPQSMQTIHSLPRASHAVQSSYMTRERRPAFSTPTRMQTTCKVRA